MMVSLSSPQPAAPAAYCDLTAAHAAVCRSSGTSTVQSRYKPTLAGTLESQRDGLGKHHDHCSERDSLVSELAVKVGWWRRWRRRLRAARAFDPNRQHALALEIHLAGVEADTAADPVVRVIAAQQFLHHVGVGDVQRQRLVLALEMQDRFLLAVVAFHDADVVDDHVHVAAVLQVFSLQVVPAVNLIQSRHYRSFASAILIRYLKRAFLGPVAISSLRHFSTPSASLPSRNSSTCSTWSPISTLTSLK